MPENINSYGYGIKYLIDHNITKESAIQFYEEYNKMLRNRDWSLYEGRSMNLQVSKDGEVPRGLYFKDAFLSSCVCSETGTSDKSRCVKSTRAYL